MERWHASCRWSGVAEAFGCAEDDDDDEVTDANVGSAAAADDADLTIAAAESKREVAWEEGFHV